MATNQSLDDIARRLKTAKKPAAQEPTPSPPAKSKRKADKADKSRPVITVTTHEFLVAAQAVELLVEDDSIYQRSGQLVRLVREEVVDRDLLAKIEFLPPAILRNRLTMLASWERLKHQDGKEVSMPCHPPDWCIAAVHQLGRWEGVRPLEAVVSSPILRRDGSVMESPGYDPQTGTFGDFPDGLVRAIGRPTLKDALRGFQTLKELLADFPFQSEAHLSAWLAGLLTPLARFAFEGPAPLFLIEANTRGAGKKLLADVLSVIVTGRRFPVTTYASEEEELRKRITSLAMGGERMVLFDNVDQKLGNAALDAALTATTWKDRMLGGNRVLELPLWMTWYATGNNCQIATDTARRVCVIRLESPEERPEERTGFKHSNLVAYVSDHRGRYLTAALSILRGYALAGHPITPEKSWGSFEGWSKVVRSALLWMSLADPAETRVKASQHADTSTSQNSLLLQIWEQLDPQRQGLTTSELIEAAESNYDIELAKELTLLLSEMFKKPDSRALGFRLRSIRRRIFDGRFIDCVGETHKVNRWTVFPQSAF